MRPRASRPPPSRSGAGNATLTVTTAANTPTGQHHAHDHRNQRFPQSHRHGCAGREAVTSAASAIGINFVGETGASMGAAESAGVVAKTNWNNATGATRSTPLALIDDTGAATGATVTWSSDNAVEHADHRPGGQPPDDERAIWTTASAARRP